MLKNKQSFPFSDEKRKGFTLIELLIVVSIIAILSVIGLVSYNYFIKNARDSRRQSDLKFIQSALEDYHGDGLYYPFQVIPNTSLTNGTKTYLNKVPSDPSGNPDYAYVGMPVGSCTSAAPQNCTSYCLFAQMETNTLTSDPGCGSLPPGFSAPKAYGVTRP